MADSGFGGLAIQAEDFTTPDQVIQLGYPPARIDILTTLSGVEFDECYESRLEVEIIGGFSIIEVSSRKEALAWTARIAEACRCAQEVREIMFDPES